MFAGDVVDDRENTVKWRSCALGAEITTEIMLTIDGNKNIMFIWLVALVILTYSCVQFVA